MKIPQFLITTGCAAAILGTPATAATIFDGYAYVSTTTAGVDSTWYNLNGSAQAGSLDGADLGDVESNLWLGGQTGFWAEGEGVQYITMHYSITGDATASGTIAFDFQSYADPNDQWGTDVNGANLTDTSIDLISVHSLTNGDYNIAVWVEGKPNNIAAVYDSNGGGNYNATFTVVPEPSSTALLGLGGLALILRRRK